MKRYLISPTVASLSLFLTWALPAAEPSKAPPGGTLHREGEPVCLHIEEGNKAMDRAVETAQKTTDKFIASLRAPKASQSRFAVKKPFVEGDKVEHIWLSDVSYDGRVFRGKVDNEPVEIKGVRRGEEVAVAANEISDWMYVENGRLVGGHTIRVMCHAMPAAERQQFEKDADCKID